MRILHENTCKDNKRPQFQSKIEFFVGKRLKENIRVQLFPQRVNQMTLVATNNLQRAKSQAGVEWTDVVSQERHKK